MIAVVGLLRARDLNLSNDDGDVELFDFVTLRSDFYPDLAKWYDEATVEWCEAQIERRNAIEDERAARAAEFEAEEALYATMSVGSPQRSEPEKGTQELDPKVVAQLRA